ncbi:geraniol 8-hydroxylase-like [Syzygium oleosum]|uniref:geraniol 8-hydroxylase-like n=1 Tax=Syzygium oleosum TaxID=219896 RepID=UPI0024BBD294|nr:geraniol 8-hydroxylase-like [Syzygium oleosum]
MDLLVLILCAYLAWGLVQALRFITRKTKPSPSNLPPGPPPLPVIGNLLELGNLPHQSLAKLARTYGPIIKLQLGAVTTVVISSPTLSKEILQTRDISFADRMIPDAINAFNQGQRSLPWVPVSPLWRNLRRIFNQHLFSNLKLDSTQHLRRKKVQELLAHAERSARAGDEVEIGEAAFTTSINFLATAVFSLDLVDRSSGSAKEFKQTVWQIMVEAGKPNVVDFFPVLRKIDPQGTRRRMTRHFGKMFNLFDRLIEERLRLRETPGSPRMNDVLDTLIDICEDKEEDMDMSQLKPLLLDVFVAGADTTSSSVEWAMAELLHRPEKLSKAQAELHQVIGKGNLVDESDAARLPYLQAIVKETFRMHPAVPLLLPRKSGADLEVGGYTIPEGTQVFVNVWAIGRDPTLWEDPDVFSPERFLGSDMDVKGHSFELTPFGGGRRICIGLPLALRTLHVMLGSLLNCFDWRLADGALPEDMSMEEKFGITLAKAQPLKAVPVPLR